MKVLPFCIVSLKIFEESLLFLILFAGHYLNFLSNLDTDDDFVLNFITEFVDFGVFCFAFTRSNQKNTVK